MTNKQTNKRTSKQTKCTIIIPLYVTCSLYIRYGLYYDTEIRLYVER